MKRKELMKRALALALSTAIAVSNMPMMTYANEVVENEADEASQTIEIASAEGDEDNDISEDADIEQAEPGQDEIIQVEAGTQLEEPVEIDNSVEGVAKQDLQIMEEGDIAEKTEEKKAAETYLQTTFCNDSSETANKLITNGGTGVTKSEDGLTYTIGLKTNGNGSAISTLFFRTMSSPYKNGWYINSNEVEGWLDLTTKTAAKRGSTPISHRPTAEQGNQSFTATLRLFSSDTDDSVINDETQAAAAALATQEFTIILEAAEPVYTMKINVVDEGGNAISDADVTLEKGWNSVAPQADGSYVMEKGAQYTLTVKKEGYNDYKESYFTFNPTEVNTEKTVTLKKTVVNNVKFEVTDKATGKAVDSATVSVKKGYYDTVKPGEDGSYALIEGTSYDYTVEANNYEKVTGTITPDGDTTVKVELTKNISKYTVYFKPVEADDTPIDNVSVEVTYEEEDYWGDTETTTLQPNKDGSYTLDKSTTYTYVMEAEGYKKITGTYKPSGDEEIINLPVIMQKDGVESAQCNVMIQPVDSDTKEVLQNADIKVTYEDYDTYYENPYTAELKSNTDGTYTMKKGIEYTCAVTAEGYENGSVLYTPDGKKATDTIEVSMTKKPVDTEDQKTVDAIKEKLDKETTFRPDYAKDKNILDVVKAKINSYSDIDTTGVKVTIKSSDAPSVIDTDGTIHYRQEALSSSGMNFTNVSVIYCIEKNGAKTETAESRTTVCWDRDYYNKQIEKEKESLTWDKIKGSNAAQTEVTSDLNLLQCMGSNLRQVWSTITWESSNTDVISIQKPSMDSPIYAATGKVAAPENDTEVTLTATFKANDVSLNEYVEKASDFATYTVAFKVTVKGTGATKPTEEELQKLLDQYYTLDQIQEFGTTTVADLKNCKTDLQLPRYTRIEDGNGEYVFNNKEITVTTDNDKIIKVNGYRAAVDRFASNDDINVNLIVTFTRDGVTVTKKIPVTVKAVTETEVQDELAMMEIAKEHYFDGINDGLYADKDSITGNLHPFQEMILDENGNPKWIYHNDDKTGKGIIPDDMFTDSWEMEGAGYNKFKSSNNAVVAHENLVVTRKEADTQITISSVLSSEKYRESAEKHPENTILQKLYKQPVSVTVTIKGTKSAAENLEKELAEAKDFCETITEGNGAGQYPAGTKEKLQAAMEEAEAVLGDESATEEQTEQALKKLTELLNAVKNTQNEVEVSITAKINSEAGKDMDVRKMTIKASTAEQYGYVKPASCKNKVTVLDVLAAWHAAKYGADFQANPTKYLVSASNGAISRIYGTDTYDIGFMINNKIPGALGANETEVKTGDVVTVYRYGDTQKYKDLYLYFEGIPETIQTQESIKLTLYGIHPIYSMGDDAEVPFVQKGYTVAALDENGNQVATAVTDENGQAVLKITRAGTMRITVIETPKDSTESAYILPEDIVKVTGETEKPAAHVHSYGEWHTVSEATVFAAEVQERECICGAKETRTVGNPLKATIKVNMTTIPLKVKQSTSKMKVTGLANGDSVVSYTSSNKKIFTVNKNGKIKAGKKKGSAKLTITLKSGLKKTVTVKVQKTTVKTKKIQNLPKSITLKKGTKKTLKPVLKPLTSQQKIRYTSSKKKVATISSKGVIKAKKNGKTTITVKSGSKKYKITVKVK